VILGLLSEAPVHGYQIMQEITAGSQGAWRPSPGTVHPALQQIEDEGLAAVGPEDGRRVYRLVGAGQKYVEEHREEIDAVLSALGDGVDETWLKTGELIRQVASAAIQVGRAGNIAQQGQVQKVHVRRFT